MKIFLDTADTEVIRKHFVTGLVDGLTTNPTLIMKSGRDPEEVYEELKEIGVPDVSMEVVGTGEEMVSEGRRLAKKFGDTATIKVPCTRGGLAACRVLAEEGIRVNGTLIFSVAQAILAAKAGASYVSPFVGRLDDNGYWGVGLVKDIVATFKEHFTTTQVLAASLRSVEGVEDCFGFGTDVVTMPPEIFEGMYKHFLTDQGLDKFDQDWKTATTQ